MLQALDDVYDNPKSTGKIILAEYDRLTAINAQLLKACRHYLINPQSPIVHDEIEAAIRAAEEA
jgi:hypothetical protein